MQELFNLYSSMIRLCHSNLRMGKSWWRRRTKLELLGRNAPVRTKERRLPSRSCPWTA